MTVSQGTMFHTQSKQTTETNRKQTPYRQRKSVCGSYKWSIGKQTYFVHRLLLLFLVTYKWLNPSIKCVLLLNHWTQSYSFVCDRLSETYTQPNWKLYTLILHISSTLLNQCVSLSLYKIGHITKALKLKSCIRVTTLIVKTDSSSKSQLIVRTKMLCSFCCHLRETYIKTEKPTQFYENTMQKRKLRL